MNSELSTLYKERFRPQELDRKNKLWSVLCTEFLRKFAAGEPAVLDISSGYFEFINKIRAPRKYAVDLNEDTNSTKSRLPAFPLLLKLYPKVSLVWCVPGEQAFVIARQRS